MDDLIEAEILERLPAKSLCRFKSVSKQWKAMIESSRIARRHLARFPNPKLFVIRSEKSSDDQCSRTLWLETISKDHNDHSKIFVCSYPDQYGESFYYHVGRIVGFCDGLVCIYHLGCIYIINTTIRKLRILSSDFLRNCSSQPGRSKLPTNVGFGRDIVTGEYKVFLTYFYDHIYNSTLRKAEVFNLNNGEQTCISCPLVYHQLHYDKASIFANGSLYWLNENLKITALDLHTELFSEILPPDWIRSIKYYNSAYLWSLRDRLCLSEVRQYPYIDIWGLQQEGPSIKWEKFLSVIVLRMDCLDPIYWKLALTACCYRRIWERPNKKFFEQVPVQHYSTALCTEDLVGLL